MAIPKDFVDLKRDRRYRTPPEVYRTGLSVKLPEQTHPKQTHPERTHLLTHMRNHLQAGKEARIVTVALDIVLSNGDYEANPGKIVAALDRSEVSVLNYAQ